MARPKKEVKRVTMKVPITFRDMVYREAGEHKVDATDYLEGKRVVPA